jgi:thiol-disulfide isomerase/thioredoxin
MLIPKVQLWIEIFFSRLSNKLPQSNANPSYWSGVLVGLSLGLLWTPCVGPILASVISLAITGTVTLDAVFITLSYAVGTAIPMFFIMYGGQNIFQKVPWLLKNTANIQKAFGVVMILTSLALLTNLDRKFQTFVIQTFPQYGAGLTKIEDTAAVQNQLEKASQTSSARPRAKSGVLQPKGVRAPALVAGGSWFNTKPLLLDELKGKVVIIDFWTYSCINCQRTIPYLKTWWEKYKDNGLVIIGVHAPEFEFEKSEKNVQKAISDFGITYPVVQDNDFATWKAYDNNYWPAKYIIDAEGFIRYSHFGEGKYDETEKVIQELLEEAGATDVSSEISNPAYTTYARTPETYLGFQRIRNFAANETIAQDKSQNYSLTGELQRNEVAFTGQWQVSSEYAKPEKNGKLLLNFESKEVFLVMRPTNGQSKVRVLVDGKPQYFGDDVQDGLVTVSADTLYKLVKLPKAENHILELQFEDNSIELYAFTFG